MSRHFPLPAPPSLVARQLSLYYGPVQASSAAPPVELSPGTDPAEFLPPDASAAPAETWTFFPQKRQLPLTPKYAFFLQSRFS